MWCCLLIQGKTKITNVARVPRDVNKMLKYDPVRRAAFRLSKMVEDFIEMRKDEDPISHLRSAGLENLLHPQDTTLQLPVGHVAPPQLAKDMKKKKTKTVEVGPEAMGMVEMMVDMEDD